MKPWEMYQQSNTSNEPKKPWELYSSKESNIILHNIDFHSNDKSTPDNTDTVDIPKIETTINSTPDIVKPEDGNSTAETSIDLTDPNKALGNPQYLTEQQKEDINTKRQQEAINSGDETKVWTDTNGQNHTTGPIGLEDESLAVMPIGKLNIVSNPTRQNMLYDDVVNGLKEVGAQTGLSREAKILLKLNQNRISADEATKILKDIPKQDQAIALANRLDLAKNYFSEAVGQDSILATKLGKQVEQRKNLIEPFIANEEDLAQASRTFGNMRTLVNEQVPNRLPTGQLNNDIKPLMHSYKTDPSPIGTTIRNIGLDLSDKEITAGTALDIRENINALLRKPSVRKSYKAKQVLVSIKSNIDKFLNTNIPQDISSTINTEIAKYSETINRKLLGDIIDKNTKADFAVDWDKVLVDMKKEGVSSQISNETVPLLKELSTKFHNDKYMSNIITPESKHQNLNALGVWSKILMETLDRANTLTDGVFAKARYKDNLLIKSIRKSIRTSDTPLDFVEGIIKKKIITAEDGNQLKQKLLEYKPEAKTTGDINLNPKYATESGTVSDTMTEPVMKERSDELIKDFVSKANSKLPDNIVEKASKILEGKRLSNIVTQVSKKMKVDDAKANTNMLQKIVTSEAKNLVKEINRQVGVKLPPEEADKIIKLKLKELMEECNK